MASSAAASVVLVGFEDLDNLGLRYLTAALNEAGHHVRLVRIEDDFERLVGSIAASHADIIGFSLIFQFYVDRFRELTDALRGAGVRSHFTCGGHYPSFEPARTLQLLPSIDSVCRFESESTLVMLADAIVAGKVWVETPEISFRSSDGVVDVPGSGGVSDLDTLPWPERADLAFEDQALPTASLLGSRGCPWRCSFCSIVAFYDQNGTKARRFRDPIRVADELEHLVEDRGIVIALWQDDDFLAGGRKGVRWAHALAAECVKRGLHRRLRWKISARSDEIRPGVLEPLVEAGLTHIYLGVESGDSESLKHLDKRLGPEAHFQAADQIRQFGLSFDFGFQLLEPWSTVDTVRANLDFLREFVGDGWSPAGFCRTLPYAGTPVEAKLRREGRLREDDSLNVDYNFLDPRLDFFYDWTLAAFHRRNEVPDGTWNALRYMSFEASLHFPGRPTRERFRTRLRELIARSNRLLVDTTEAALDHIVELGPNSDSDGGLSALAAMHERQEHRLRLELTALGSSKASHVPVHLTV